MIVIAFWVVWDQLREQRRIKRVQRFNKYVEKLHTQPADMFETFAHFSVMQIYAKHGTDKQLDELVQLMHGHPPME